jgi:heme-degrading monooxygenase HmoA
MKVMIFDVKINPARDVRSVKVFQSVTNPSNDRIVYIAYFDSADSIEKWRNDPKTQIIEQTGHRGVLDDYRVVIATNQRDYGLTNRPQAPQP